VPKDLISPLSIVLGLVGYGLIANWYVLPALLLRPRAKALVPLILPHCFRYVGLAFLLPGVTAQPLDPRFANPAAYGDLLAALLAFASLFALRCGWRSALGVVWLFNFVGILDLLNAIALGLRYSHNGSLGATYFVLVLAVPALLILHVVIFILLLRAEANQTNINSDFAPAE
jgi:hypothetical protein